MVKNIENDLAYTGIEDKSFERFFSEIYLKKVAEIESRFVDEELSNHLKRQGVKIVIPFNIIDLHTRIEVLLGLNLSGHTNTLTEASNLIDDLYKRGEIQNEQHYRNATDKFHTNFKKVNYLLNFQNRLLTIRVLTKQKL